MTYSERHQIIAKAAKPVDKKRSENYTVYRGYNNEL